MKLKIPNFLGWGRWISLIGLAVILPFFTGKHWFSALCPNGALIAAIPWALWNPIDPVLEEPTIVPGALDFSFWLKIGILAFFLIWFVLSKRPFCRTTCPLGLIYSWFNRFSLIMPEVKHTCPDCDQCETRCPVGLEVRSEINNSQCIKCLDCLACNYVEYRWNWKLNTYRQPKFKKQRRRPPQLSTFPLSPGNHSS